MENSASSVSEASDRSATKSNALRRRPGRRFDKSKLKRRCSINGHYYNRETSIFTPPYGNTIFANVERRIPVCNLIGFSYNLKSGSTMSVWTTSLVNTKEVINMLLDKYRVECPVNNFSLFLVKDNGGILSRTRICVGPIQNCCITLAFYKNAGGCVKTSTRCSCE